MEKVYVINDLFGILVNVNECDKSCDKGKYLDYKNCKCKKKLVDKLIKNSHWYLKRRYIETTIY